MGKGVFIDRSVGERELGANKNWGHGRLGFGLASLVFPLFDGVRDYRGGHALALIMASFLRQKTC